MACSFCKSNEESRVYRKWVPGRGSRSYVCCRSCYDEHKLRECRFCGHSWEPKSTGIRQAKNWYRRVFVRGSTIDNLQEFVTNSILRAVALPENTDVCHHCAQARIMVYLRNMYSRCDLCRTRVEISAYTAEDGLHFELYGVAPQPIPEDLDHPENGSFPRKLCSDCMSHYALCSVCGRLADSSEILGDDGCASCVDELLAVNNWDYRPRRFVTHSLPREKIDFTYGLEYEFPVSGSRDAKSHLFQKRFAQLMELSLKDLGKYLYCVHDGSIDRGGRHGFEAVLHPMTLPYIYQTGVLDKVEEAITQTEPSVNQYLQEHTQCGLHIHMSRAKLSPAQVYKMTTFCHSNRENLEVVGRRQFNQYCRTDVAVNTLVSNVLKGTTRDSRYEVCNIHNRDTIEFRFFKGTEKAEQVYAALEFIEALRLWTHSAGLNDIRFTPFLDMVLGRRKDYPNLARLLDWHISDGHVFRDSELHPRAVYKRLPRQERTYGTSPMDPMAIYEPQAVRDMGLDRIIMNLREQWQTARVGWEVDRTNGTFIFRPANDPGPGINFTAGGRTGATIDPVTNFTEDTVGVPWTMSEITWDDVGQRDIEEEDR